MKRTLSRRRIISLGLLGGVGLATGCGTLLYPERRGQPAGPLDWKVVALDAVGLLLFFIPGIIAFAVDFSNGTIYLPAGHYGAVTSAGERRLTSQAVPRQQLTPRGIEQIVSQHAGRDVRLVADEFQTQEIASPEDFWTAHDRLSNA